MGRMLDALKALESRAQESPVAPIVPSRSTEPPRSADSPHDVTTSLPVAAVFAGPRVELARLPILPAAPATREEPKPVAASKTPPSTAWIDLPKVPRACALPAISELSDPYLDLAGRMGEQLAENYCNVVLFTTPDRFSDAGFSVTQLAQAVALQSPGDVLLVDGDLIGRRLSKGVCPGSQGLVEVMLGVAQWPDVVHTTNLACIDFVSCGQAQVPTLERSQFGWEALRPQYRAVLIGLSEVPRPETNWLAARCDAVYLVLARRHTQRHAASAATSALRACGANLVGCVVTED